MSRPTQPPSATLRREILEAALKGQELQQATQGELERQGRQLDQSLGAAAEVARQADETRAQAGAFEKQARAVWWRQLYQCSCYYLCCQRSHSGDATPKPAGIEAGRFKLANPLAGAQEVDVQKEVLSAIDRLERDKDRRRGQKDGGPRSWKRTLAPPPGARTKRSKDTWQRQMDASLGELQRTAEEMDKSLEEQSRLAQMLTIYLEHGADQAAGANETLTGAAAK